MTDRPSKKAKGPRHWHVRCLVCTWRSYRSGDSAEAAGRKGCPRCGGAVAAG